MEENDDNAEEYNDDQTEELSDNQKLMNEINRGEDELLLHRNSSENNTISTCKSDEKKE